MLLEEPRWDAMLLTAGRLAGQYIKLPWLVMSVLQKLQNLEPLFGKAVTDTMTSIHDTIDLFLAQLFAQGKVLGDNVRQVYRLKGLIEVLVTLRNSNVDMASPEVQMSEAFADLVGDRYKTKGTPAAIFGLLIQLTG
ncbi:hypothetical protein SARC_06714 [Sphaeroforma arctica JP610]|uniref:Uncharacterized protein n=1 Tax=Sphaeroforma arctica JP610 TaxID=667725 RepID=A0A0L0FWC0_9EUKA|nr:hypothetical protein SARC_06714 [Sphaeroforma arctica JP610]KNC80949.1 hypothetical protein SARC_06714 [Sphaeroforma arctica JP610]|eukprot:XP_014154851.1 hypothetical protein SARC_06714 [Sphaeroforma arctica JP610]